MPTSQSEHLLPAQVADDSPCAQSSKNSFRTIRSRIGSDVSSSTVEGHLIVPLISDLDHEAQKLSTNGLTLNLTMTILGTTVLGICAQMKRGGWLLTPLLLCLMAAIVAEMVRLVSMTINHLRNESGLTVRSYQAFAEGALGRWGKRWSSVTSTGDMVVYTFVALVLEAQNLQVLFPISLPWFGCTDCGQKWWAVLLSSTTLMYAFLDLAPLASFAAKFGPAACFSMVFLAIVGSLTTVSQSSEFPEACFDNAVTSYWIFLPNTERIFMDVASIASYCMFCFAVVVLVPSVQHEMEEPAKLGSAGSKSFVFSCVCFLSMMCLQYGGSGNLGAENLIEGMRSNRPAGWWALTNPWETGTPTVVGQLLALATTVNMLFADMLYVPCAVIAIEELIPEIVVFGGLPVRIIIRLGLAFLRLWVAVGASSFIALSSLTSSLFCVSNNILIPIIAFHCTVRKTEAVGVARTAVHSVIFAFASFIAIFGTLTAASALLFPPDLETTMPGIFPRPGISQQCRTAYAEQLAGKQP